MVILAIFLTVSPCRHTSGKRPTSFLVQMSPQVSSHHVVGLLWSPAEVSSSRTGSAFTIWQKPDLRIGIYFFYHFFRHGAGTRDAGGQLRHHLTMNRGDRLKIIACGRIYHLSEKNLHPLDSNCLMTFQPYLRVKFY